MGEGVFGRRALNVFVCFQLPSPAMRETGSGLRDLYPHSARCIFKGGTTDMTVRKIKFPDFVLFVPSW